MKQIIIIRDGAPINYTITGDGEITLLFVHGAFIDQTYWNDQVNYFSQHYKVVTMDLPGHGKSGEARENWSVKDFAKDVVSVIEELNLAKVILIGHSLGAVINLLAAASYNPYDGTIIGFIGIDNFKNAAIPLASQYEKQAAVILQNLKADFAGTSEQYARMALLTKYTPADISNRVVKDYRNGLQTMGIAIMNETFNIHETEKKWLPQLAMPLYLINVDYTPTNEAALKKLSTNGYEVLHMKGSGNFPMLENPFELNILLQQVIEKITTEKRNNRQKRKF